MWINQMLRAALLFAISCVVPADRGRRLNLFVEHFEPLSYRPVDVHRSHMRVKRSVSTGKHVYLQFRGHNRNFHLKLKQDSSFFHKDFVIETTERGSVDPDTSHIYTGRVVGDPSSYVYGALLDGVFEGGIETRRGHFYIDRAAKHFDHLTPFHSVLYSAADVKFPAAGKPPHSWCGVTGETEHWMNKVVEAQSLRRAHNNVGRSVPGPWLNRHLQSLTKEYAQDEIGDEPGQLDENNRNFTRRALEISRRVCNLQINIDHTLFSKYYESEQDHMKTHASLKNLVFTHVSRASKVYRSTNFGGVEDISFAVQHIKINDSTHCIGEKLNTNPFCSTALDSAFMLHLASKGNHDDFCLSYTWTYRDFADGVLGLAWMAKSSGFGGICEKNKPSVDIAPGSRSFQHLYLSLNTGIMTFINHNSFIPQLVSEITLIHEMGHSFGSPHDNDSVCAPGGEEGNFIMFPSATSGTRHNNHLFSSCSVGNISAILVPLFEGKSSRENCFQPDRGPICGNTMVEGNETCDCGYTESECNDECCYARQNNDNEEGCSLKPNARCSPTAGPCCTVKCNPVGRKVLCAPEGFCTKKTFCDGQNAACPAPALKPNLTECNERTQVCINGECAGSICLKYGMMECSQTGSYLSVEELCLVACRSYEDANECKPLCEFEKTKSLCNLRLQPGSPCNGLRGYCDVFQKCRNIDEEGPLARLQRVFFGGESFNAIHEFVTSHPFVSALLLIAFVWFMVFLFRCFAVHTPTSNPHKKPAYKLKDTIRRPLDLFK